jgi:hypothetical protein
MDTVPLRATIVPLLVKSVAADPVFVTIWLSNVTDWSVVVALMYPVAVPDVYADTRTR